MPQEIDELIELLELDEVGDLVFRGEHPRTQMQRSFGGQVLAQALSAAYRTVPDDRFCHSMSGYFLRPGSTDGPIDYGVTLTRDGRGFSTRRIVAEQDGRSIFAASGSFKVPEVGLEHQIAPHEPPTPPGLCPPLSEVLARNSKAGRKHWDDEWGVLDVRYVSSSLDNPVDSTARMMVWVKTVDSLGDDPRLHQQVLAYASDLTILAVATVSHNVDFYSPRMQMATINHSMWFHRQIRADGWVLYDQLSPSASNGLGYANGRLYSAGVLGASCAQEGLIRLLPEANASGQASWLKPSGS